ncbi:MAG: hypothetical protein HYV63_23425 [Candidatus Schekmanbacteria bacterium]|nr:hypothetical protein [Candidatus Schekmanbacteria bacterium]
MNKGFASVLSVLVVAGAFGFKYFNKSQAHDDVKQRLIEVCEGDQNCIKVVENNYERCFSQAYSMGSRRRSSSFDTDKLATCLNGASPVAYFVVSKD